MRWFAGSTAEVAPACAAPCSSVRMSVRDRRLWMPMDFCHLSEVAMDIGGTPLPPVGSEIGIELGLTHLAVMSNGTKIAAPKFLRRAARKLADAGAAGRRDRQPAGRARRGGGADLLTRCRSRRRRAPP